MTSQNKVWQTAVPSVESLEPGGQAQVTFGGPTTLLHHHRQQQPQQLKRATRLLTFTIRQKLQI